MVWVKGSEVALFERNAVADPVELSFAPGDLQHRISAVGGVHAYAALRQVDGVLPGAAAEFEHVVAGCKGGFQPIPYRRA